MEPEDLEVARSDDEDVKPQQPRTTALLSCLTYASMSIVMILINKWLATAKVEAQVSFLFMQNVVATSIVSLVRLCGFARFDDMDAKTASGWLPINVSFVIMLWSSFAAMRHLSVPMITVFKQLANLLTCVGELYFFGKKVSPIIFVSFGIMIFGAGLAATKDLAFSFQGYAWQIVNCVATSAYVLSLRHATTHVKLSRLQMVFYNNVLSLPLLLALVVVKREPHLLNEAVRLGDINATVLLGNAATGLISVGLSLASIWCVAATSATTYAVAGALNKLPVAILGSFLFDAPISRQGAIYIAVSLCGGFLYTYESIISSSSSSSSDKTTPKPFLLPESLSSSSSDLSRHTSPRSMKPRR